MDIKELLHYRTFEKIGEGINGVVYKAWDTKQNRIVAVKVFNTSSNDINLKENLELLKEVANVEHPNLCNIHSIDESDNYPFIVMEYIEGKTLEQIISEQPPQKINFLDTATQITRGLKELHYNQIIHGNLKPSNIMISDNGEVKILDACLSKIKHYHHKSEFDSPIDELYYLSPEQIKNENISDKSDLFSFGVILYQIVSGDHPFAGDSEDSLSDSILNKAPDFEIVKAKKIPGVYILLIEKLLAKKPADRFLHSGELLITLQEMKLFNKKINRYHPDDQERKNPRKYLMITVLAVLLIILWLIVTSYR